TKASATKASATKASATKASATKASATKASATKASAAKRAGRAPARRGGSRQRSGEPEMRAVTSVVSAFPALLAPGLTQRQRLILGFIRNAVERNGSPPSVREIGEAVGLVSPSSVAYQLKELERKGYLRRDPNRPRAVDVRPPSELIAEEDEEAVR